MIVILKHGKHEDFSSRDTDLTSDSDEKWAMSKPK